MEAYLDNSATTPVCPEAVKAVNNVLTNFWGNPSSLHFGGIEAAQVLDDARSSIARRLSCEDDEIIFTSGGTEANNLALFGAAHAYRSRGMRIIISSVEHPSVNEPANQLEKQGYDVIRLHSDKEGRFDERQLFAAVNSATSLVSIMSVNNEVGTIQAVEKVKQAVKRFNSPALVHCDAVQAFGKIPLKPSALGVDLMTISSHKIHGPKGAGALYVRKGAKIAPHIFGGGQEQGKRPGTEPLPAIAGFAAAADALPDLRIQLEKTTQLRDYMLARLAELNDIVVNSPADALPYVTNISVLGIPSEVMLNYLSEMNIYVSGGSACSKGKRSRVLSAMELEQERINSAVRISFSRYTTRAEVDYLIDGIASAQKSIMKRTFK
ncbi:MAG: cysteine desulfurase [Clostridia bacterium]|nr:cysteine desulfurase [Clostridia bacterium]